MPERSGTAALAALNTAYASHTPVRVDGDAVVAHESSPVVGTVGRDVPVELVAAAGALPLRLRGDLRVDTTEADRYLGVGLDPAVRSLLAALLEGRFGRLDAIVVSTDTDASARLYYLLRELRRVDPGLGIPPIHLVDVLHLPRDATTEYVRVRLRQFADVLERWMGQRPEGDALASAVAAHDARRELLRELGERRGAPGGLSGREFLAVVGAGSRMPVADHLALLRAIHTDPPAAAPAPGTDSAEPPSAVRVYLTGSGHDEPAVIAAIEDAGARVVADDVDWSGLETGPAAVEPTLDALARRYQYDPGPQRATIAARAERVAAGADRADADLLLSYVREYDEAPLWDFPDQRASVRVPARLIARQPYGAIDADALASALADAQEVMHRG